MAKWAIARRTEDLTNTRLDANFGTGSFLRTHVLRPTWHFVVPEDLTWIMALTAPRVHRLMAGHNKTIALTDLTLERAAEVILAALPDGKALTRAQLAEHLQAAGIEASGTTLAHIVINCELLALICSGPLVGKQHTYVRVPESVSTAPILTTEEALARLAVTYVRGHGPSQPADLSWWSSLNLTQSRLAFDLAGLDKRTIDGEDYWCSEFDTSSEPLPRAALMPPFDESISYVRKPIENGRFPDSRPDLARGGGLLFIDGLIGGTWGRRAKARTVELSVTVDGKLPRDLMNAIESEAERYAVFIGLELDLRVNA